MTKLAAPYIPVSAVDYSPVRRRQSSSSQGLRLIAFAGLLVICIPAILAMDVKWSVTLPLSILVSIIGQHLVAVALDPAEDPFEPITLVSANFLISMAGRTLYILAIMPDAKRIGRVGYDDYLPEALWCSCLAYIAILMGYYSAWGKSTRAYQPKREFRWPESISPIRVAALATVSFLVLVYLFRQGVVVVGGDTGRHGGTPNGFVLLVTHALPLAWIASCIWLTQARRAADKPKALLLVLLCLIYVVGTIAITGGKTAMFEPLLEGLIVFHYLRKRFGVFQLTAIGLPAIVLAFGVINFYRFVTVVQHGSPKSFTDIANLVSSAAESIGGKTGGRSSAFAQMFDRQCGIDTFAVVMKYTPNPRPFTYGSSLIPTLLAASVPRQLWPDKPIYDQSYEFERNYLGMPPYYHGHTSPQLAADLYQNLGLPGVFVGMFIFGVLLGRLFRICAPGRNRPAGVFFYAFLLPLVSFWTAVTVGYIIVILPRMLVLSVVAAMFLGLRYRMVRLFDPGNLAQRRRGPNSLLPNALPTR